MNDTYIYCVLKLQTALSVAPLLPSPVKAKYETASAEDRLIY